MPGLLRGVARTAVVAGTATAVSNRVSRRQANRWSQQNEPQPQYAQQPRTQPQYYELPPQYAPAGAGACGSSRSDPIEKLKKLAELRDQGILTEEEFTAAEGEDPRRLAPDRRTDALPVPAPRDLDAVRRAAQPHRAGRLQPAAAAAVRLHPPGRPRRANGGSHTIRSPT